ncbi:MAG: nucleotidyltransferase domain-containing protein [Armatimonadetes bacterium]|nr:nucleotidyltransferase domain-containing protein [Armatimonadota bacterium]
MGVSKNELHPRATNASLPGISEEDMAAYRATARRRLEQEERELALRRKRAWETVRQAAKLLKEDFGAQRVVVFGSLLRPGCFNRWSDVDIAAWGIGKDDTFRAVGAVMDLGRNIEINLMDMDTCRATLRAIIEREGQEI